MEVFWTLRRTGRCFARSADGRRELRRLIARVERLQARARARGRLTRGEAQELETLLREIQAWTRAGEPRQLVLFAE